MFYFFRLFCIVLEAIVKAVWRRVRGSVDNGAAVLSETRQWRCMPWDLDEYRHMNNCAYFVFTEMGRRALLYALWQRDATLRRQLASAVAAGHYMRYRKSLQCFQSFSVHTSIVGTRGRSMWFEQRFVDAKGFVCAQSICRVTLVDREGVAFRCLGLDKEIAVPRLVELYAQTDEESSEMLKK